MAYNYRSGLTASSVCPVCTKDTPHSHRDLSRHWIGVDLDGTLARDIRRKDPYEIGEPIPDMQQRVKGWVAQGYRVKLMTARMCRFSHTLAE